MHRRPIATAGHDILILVGQSSIGRGPCAGTVAAVVVDNILDTLPVEIQAAARAKLARYTEELKERYI